ncbi:Putative protein [Zobellia galactanivorans]|uniref:Uncharacterized protein n=1 Tax=Zobellia galactanivorans (strain DSM 12802 / CCUG 47099 / CIP 106680 / NCIMB 13871 / Dsij) TaxID=63186 RepID=G0L6T8_ZOBGA|nr:Putative protein [Zobellia galactanivorans]
MQYHKLFTYAVKNAHVIFAIFEAEIILWKIKGYHSANLMIFFGWMKQNA